MTPEAQRIAIAEACGTLACPGCSWEQIKCYAHDYEIPDYLNDLNAMHEAEKVLTNEQWPEYVALLEKHGCAATWMKHMFFVHATAAQRAEAFLRTLGLWTEAV